MSWADDWGIDAWDIDDYFTEDEPSKAQQERDYFTHLVTKNRGVDIRTIDANYAKNLYRWYADRGTSEDLIFMKTLKDLSDLSALEDFKNL